MTDVEPTEPTEAFAGDAVAESTVLAACLNAPAAITAARRTLTAESFFWPNNEKLFGIMAAIDDNGGNVSPQSVYDGLRFRKLLGTVPAASLFDLYAFPYVADWVPWAIRRVADLGRRRQATAIVKRLAQMNDEASDFDTFGDIAMPQLVNLEVLLDDRADQETVPNLHTWDEFIARPTREADAVIPGLLDRSEVVMLLAAPGAGKSWLSRQVAMAVASGVHPFVKRRVPQMRSLLVDLENPDSTVQRQAHGPYYAARHLGDGLGDRGWIWTHTEGLNIRKRQDAALLERVIADTRPDIVCVGSLYNLFSRGSSDWDTAAEETIAVLNRIRTRYRCALWIEHHMPRGTDSGPKMSPFGSTLWERWPAYGRVLSRVGGDYYELKPFRGDREAGREFPLGLERTDGRATEWPWRAVWDQVVLDSAKADFAKHRGSA